MEIALLIIGALVVLAIVVFLGIQILSIILTPGFMYLAGTVCLLLAPFTGFTIVGAAAFFVIGWIISH